MVRLSPLLPLLLGVAYISSVAAEMPAAWTYADAAKWARNEDLHANFVSNIKKHEIDGKTLMALEDKDVKDEMEVTSGIARKKIMAAIATLKAGATDPADNEDPPLESEGENAGKPKFYEDFTAYRAVKENRRRADFSMGILINCPHFGIPKVDRMGLGPADKCGWFEYLVVPGYYVSRKSDEVLYGLPWLASQCVQLKILDVPAALFKGMQAPDPVAGVAGGLTVIFITEMVAYILSVIAWYAYPIVPWFISDIVFYAMSCGPIITLWAGIFFDVGSFFAKQKRN